jgi:enoyl-CoA hydratase
MARRWVEWLTSHDPRDTRILVYSTQRDGTKPYASLRYAFMNNFDSCVHSTIDGAIATVTLSRPDVLNAITREMLVQLSETLDLISANEAVRVVVLTGEGRAFSAGVDLKALGGRELVNGSIGELLDGPAREAIKRLTTIPQVVIARLNGACFTGALELVLACDLVVAANEAKIGDTHAKWGLRPSWGMSQRLVRALGVTRARELSYTARTFSGADAAEWGLAIRAVPLVELDEAVTALANSVLANSPGSLVAYKDLYRRALDTVLVDGLAQEAVTRYSITDTESRIAGFR